MARPVSKFVKALSSSDREFLQQVWKEHRVYTVRCRAHAMLLSAEGYSVSQLQDIFQISKPTALAWIDRWNEQGRDGLEDEPRSGGPPILNEQDEETLKELLERFPRQPRKVLQALKQETGKEISRSTLRRLARKLGFRWKRFRRSMKKQRDEEESQAAQQDLQEVRAASDTELAFFDEAAFSLQGVVPYGWQPIGERNDVPLSGQRGNVHVLGIHEQSGSTLGYLHKGYVYGTTVAEILDDYSHRISRPTLLVLDNASVHTCGLIEQQLATWNDRGLYLYHLPTYSPELNSIERLWKTIKYEMLPLNAWETLSSLVSGLQHVFNQLGDSFLMPSLQS